jgi:hypothetical protein
MVNRTQTDYVQNKFTLHAALRRGVTEKAIVIRNFGSIESAHSIPVAAARDQLVVYRRRQAGCVVRPDFRRHLHPRKG